MFNNRSLRLLCWFIAVTTCLVSCQGPETENSMPNAAQILGNSDYPCIAYGGYRHQTREIVPGVEDIKEDMRILHALGFRVIRTYHAQQYGETRNLVQAISELKTADPDFEMYIMMGAWMECLNSFTDSADHSRQNYVLNKAEIEAAVEYARRYPDIVKIIAVGNEAMVHWASGYYVDPQIILEWVRYLQDLKKRGELGEDLWITSSDNFASWGGGDQSYKKPALEELIKTVDYVSLHTYPFHDTHYNPDFWIAPDSLAKLSDSVNVRLGMRRALEYARSQYYRGRDYVHSVDSEKPVHIGETGWSTSSPGFYGDNGSGAADEFKQKLYYDAVTSWCRDSGISCFYFEAFDEPWKDANDPAGSENHFGLINIRGEAKYVIWDEVDQLNEAGLLRGGRQIQKSYGGDLDLLLQDVATPPSAAVKGRRVLRYDNADTNDGVPLLADVYLLFEAYPYKTSKEAERISYPASSVLLNGWEGSCELRAFSEKYLELIPGDGPWWGCALEFIDGATEDLSKFGKGILSLEIESASLDFRVGFQSGHYAEGDLINHDTIASVYAKEAGGWQKLQIPIADIAQQQKDLKGVSAPLMLMSNKAWTGDTIRIRNIAYRLN